MDRLIADWAFAPGFVGQAEIVKHASIAENVSASRHLGGFRWIQADGTLAFLGARNENLYNLVPLNENIWRDGKRPVVKCDVVLDDKLAVCLQILLLVEIIFLAIGPMLVITMLGERTSSNIFRLLCAVVMEVQQVIEVLLLASMIKNRVQLVSFHQSGGLA